jgi:anti-sigma28 factor (negative regulator of flagellin synthesis)
MSIRIQNDGLSGTSASQAERTQATENGSGSPLKNGTGPSSGGGDHVSLSSLSANIAAASHVDEVQQAARLHQLTALYQSGQYHVDSGQLSRSLVSRALDAGGVGDGS